MIDTGNRSKTLNEVKTPVENMNKNPENFLKICPLKRKSLLHINYKVMYIRELFWNNLKILPESMESSKFVSQ